LEESKKFELIDYSMERDYYNGLDIKITYKKREFFISLFIDTIRGNYFKHKKTTRHDYSSVHEIELSVNFNSLTKLGSVYVLNQSHIHQLENTLNDIKE
jgi:hypothetical protein